MRIGTLVLVILLFVVGLVGCSGISSYNALVAEDENVNKAWSNVESTYQRRSDLIPNLVNTVKGAANFEQETLEAVVNARAKATSINLSADDLNDPTKVEAFQEAQTTLGQSIGRLLVAVEAYPELRATEAFRDLQNQLEGTENRINVARDRYNEAATTLNTMIRSFPTNLVAGFAGIDKRPTFEAEKGAERAPEVNFN